MLGLFLFPYVQPLHKKEKFYFDPWTRHNSCFPLAGKSLFQNKTTLMKRNVYISWKMECVQHQVISLLRGELGVSVAHFCYLIMLLLFCFLRTLVSLKHPLLPSTPDLLKILFTSLLNFSPLELSQWFWWVDESMGIICSTTCLYFLTPHFLVIATYSLSVIPFYGPHIQPPKNPGLKAPLS